MPELRAVRPSALAGGGALGARISAFAALLRTAGSIVLPRLGLSTPIAAGILGATAFALVTASDWPILTSPRGDARPG